jgi:hypothetical protein
MALSLLHFGDAHTWWVEDDVLFVQEIFEKFGHFLMLKC